MMLRLKSLLLTATGLWLCAATGTLAQGQRKTYPQPRMTEAVRSLQASRTPWKATRGADGPLPAGVDNSVSPYFPPILDQQGGSCAQASGIGYLFTYEMNRLLGRDARTADNRFSYLFAWNMINGGADEGGFVDEGLFIATRYGMMTEADFGYASTYQFKWASGYEKYLNALRYRADEVLKFDLRTAEDIDALKRYLYDGGNGGTSGGIVTFSTCSSGWGMDTDYQGPSATGYHTVLTRLATEGAHALTIAGYDDLVEFKDANDSIHRGAFIVVNTWGSYMHDNGRFYLPYYFFLHRSQVTGGLMLSDNATGVVPRYAEPKVVMGVAVDYSSRNDLSFRYGMGETIEANRPAQYYSLAVFNNQGGDYPMQGNWSASGTMEFAIDCTERLPAGDELPKTFFLNVVRSSRGSKTGEGKLTGFSVTDYRGAVARRYVYRQTEAQSLVWGENIFRLQTAPRRMVSAAPWRWGDESMKPLPQTLLIRTAHGGYAKVEITGYDAATGKLELRYACTRNTNGKFE